MGVGVSEGKGVGVGKGLGWVEGFCGSGWVGCSICVGVGLCAGMGVVVMGMGEGLGWVEGLVRLLLGLRSLLVWALAAGVTFVGLVMRGVASVCVGGEEMMLGMVVVDFVGSVDIVDVGGRLVLEGGL